MHIKHITVKNFRCFEHLEFDLNPDINIFVGNNGSGKSAVLDAIAAVMFHYIINLQIIVGTKNQEQIPIFQRDFSVAKKSGEETTQAEFKVAIDNFPNCVMIYNKMPTGDDNERISLNHSSLSQPLEENQRLSSELRGKFLSLKNNPRSDLSIIAYYKSNRNLSNDTNLKTIINKSFDRFDSLKNSFDATANFTDLINWFFIREFEELRQGKSHGDINYELPDLKQVRNAIKTIIHPEARVYCTQTTSVKLMVEWTMETGEKRELTLNQLSAGYRNIAILNDSCW
jgi:predicted ATP-binding protein involved in virulence